MSEPQAAAQQSQANRRQGRSLRTGKSQVYTHRSRTVAVPEGYLAVGYIAGVHGLKGEVKVELYTDFPERFVPGVKLFLGEEVAETTIVSARLHKNNLLLLLEGIERREQAEALRGTWLFVDEEHAVGLDQDTYWVHDIIGMEVQTETGERLGTIIDVLFTGANDVYVVETAGLVNQGKELLLPAIADVVRQVNLDANLMTVHLLPGLIEE
jgi:16S rRNA processing protein RimM